MFGSNNQLSLWFYLFNINQTNDFSTNNDLNLVTIFPQLYGTTNLNWALNNISNVNQATTAQFVINNIRLYTPAYFVIGANVVKQNLVNPNGLLNAQQTAIYSLHLGLVPAPISAITNNNQFGYKISANYYNSDNLNYSNLFVSGMISQTKVAQITNNLNLLMSSLVLLTQQDLIYLRLILRPKPLITIQFKKIVLIKRTIVIPT